MIRASLAVIALLAAGAAPAQAPLSAIDWLQDTAPGLPLDAPPPFEPPVTTGVTVPDIRMQPLDAPRADAVGLLAETSTGLPRSLWQASDSATIRRALDRIGEPALPAVQALHYTLLLAEAAAPRGTRRGAGFLRTRLAALKRMGAVEPALALVEQASPATPALFDIWLDLALLMGREDGPCAALSRDPWLSPDIAARIFCSARTGDWQTAALSFDVARALGRLSGARADLLAGYLDPEFAAHDGLMPPAAWRITPLEFRLFEAAGAPLPTGRLPRAFAMADLRGTSGWKAELEAAERLARTGALPPARLLGLYIARRPAASGGVWDRAAAVQAVNRGLDGGPPAALARALPRAWDELHDAGLRVALAQMIAPRLLDKAPTLAEELRGLATEIVLLSPQYEQAPRLAGPAPASQLQFLLSVAQGRPQAAGAVTPAQKAVLAGFTGTAAPRDARHLLDQGRLGQAILQAAQRLDRAGPEAPAALAGALATLRRVGLEDSARRAALQVLLLRTGP